LGHDNAGKGLDHVFYELARLYLGPSLAGFQAPISVPGLRIGKKVQGVVLGTLTTPSERFTDIYKWYIETNHVWKIFAKQKLLN
jgi:hypothetical protein